MTNTIVSVRIPESMMRELKERIKKDHYLDLSEGVRSIVRRKWLEWKDPSSYQIKKLREEIKEVVKEKAEETKEEQLLDELERIKQMILDKAARK